MSKYVIEIEDETDCYRGCKDQKYLKDKVVNLSGKYLVVRECKYSTVCLKLVV